MFEWTGLTSWTFQQSLSMTTQRKRHRRTSPSRVWVYNQRTAIWATMCRFTLQEKHYLYVTGARKHVLGVTIWKSICEFILAKNLIRANCARWHFLKVAVWKAILCEFTVFKRAVITHYMANNSHYNKPFSFDVCAWCRSRQYNIVTTCWMSTYTRDVWTIFMLQPM